MVLANRLDSQPAVLQDAILVAATVMQLVMDLETVVRTLKPLVHWVHVCAQ